MVAKKYEISIRINGEKYSAAPEGHRTTFIVGALDMLCFVYLYAAPEHRARIDAMIQYSSKYESDTLRQQFDVFIRQKDERQKQGAANSFFVALNEWCGFDN